MDGERADDGTAESSGLSFPDLPRLELDQLLEQLVDRAQEVMGTQGRLRGLLRASQMVTGDLALPTVLRRIAEAAKELVGAHYAALGVIGADGHLTEFVHTGMSARTVERIGRLPEGKGLLGALVENREPIRIDTIADDSRSSGLPAHHPPMTSFLGVPIQVRGTAFGNLYLAESHNGRFSAEDEELAKALAATAGTAIDNARLYQAANARQKWLEATNAITRRLLSTDLGSPLTLIAEHTRDNAEADLVTVARPTTTGGELRIEAAVGIGAKGLLGMVVPVDRTLSGRVFTSGEPVVGSWRDSYLSTTTVMEGVDIDPVLVVPLVGLDRVHGVLTAARLHDRARFTDDELRMAAAFANQASVSIELAEARAEQHLNDLYEDRDRIGADLRTRAIERLFGAAMSLQATAAGTRDERAAARLLGTIRELDEIASEIRTSVFELEDLRPTTSTPQDRLHDELTRAAPALGFSPSFQLAGRLEHLPAPHIDALVDTVRDALAVVARTDAARSAEVVVTVSDRLDVVVTHDGTGQPDDIADLTGPTAAADRLGGTCGASTSEAGIARIAWSVPLSG